MTNEENKFQAQTLLNMLGPLLCWADGVLDEQELNAADEIGKQLFSVWSSDIFRSLAHSMSELPDDESALKIVVKGLIDSANAEALSEEEKKSILTFLTTVAMADGDFNEKERLIIDITAEAFGLLDETSIPSEADLQKAKARWVKKTITAPSLIDQKAMLNLLATVRTLNSNVPMHHFGAIWDDVLAFVNRGALYAMLTKQHEENGEILMKEHASDWELIKKGPIQPAIEKIDFIKFIAQLMQEDFNWMSAMMLDMKFAATLSALTEIFYMHRYLELQSSENLENLVIPDIADHSSFLPLQDLLKREYGWNENAFSNGCGRIDIVNNRAGLKPHTTFLKRIFKSPEGSDVELATILTPMKTKIRFKPERLFSIVNSRDANFWLQYFKNETVCLGPVNIQIDMFGLPTEKMKPDEDESILNRELFFLGFRQGSRDTQVHLLDVETKKIWQMPSIVFYGCSAIEVA